jgi:hypothetical protein
MLEGFDLLRSQVFGSRTEGDPESPSIRAARAVMKMVQRGK